MNERDAIRQLRRFFAEEPRCYVYTYTYVYHIPSKTDPNSTAFRTFRAELVWEDEDPVNEEILMIAYWEDFSLPEALWYLSIGLHRHSSYEEIKEQGVCFLTHLGRISSFEAEELDVLVPVVFGQTIYEESRDLPKGRNGVSGL